MDLFACIDTARARWNVLEHPFYTRWERGELSEDELAYYAGQYRHAVVALAEASAEVVEHAEHAGEERAHIALWDDFAASAGAGPAPARRETAECVEAWRAGRTASETLAVLYAVESAQPEISRTKLRGLVEHYGRREDGPATAYFRVHAERDAVHAREARELLEGRLATAHVDRAAALAENALRANWRLLDGVESGLRGKAS
jgi:pyrroloquinoline-quinone synthase